MRELVVKIRSEADIASAKAQIQELQDQYDRLRASASAPITVQTSNKSYVYDSSGNPIGVAGGSTGLASSGSGYGPPTPPAGPKPPPQEAYAIGSEREAQIVEKQVAALKEKVGVGEVLIRQMRDTNDPKEIKAQEDQIHKVRETRDEYKELSGALTKWKEAHPDKESVLGMWDGLMGKLRGVQQAYHEAGGGVVGFASILRTALTSAAGMATAALGALFGIASHGVKAFEGLENAVTDLNAALAAAGRFNNEYSETLQKMAHQFETTTGVAKEQWMEALGQLTKFGARPDNIEQYAKAVENLAGVMNTSVGSAAMIFSRVLEGNFYMLHRYGIQVDHTKTQLENLDYIMQQLEKKGAGILEARTETLAGQFHALTLKLHETWEGIGEIVAGTGILQAALSGVKDLVAAMNSLFPETVKNTANVKNRFDEMAAAAKLAAKDMQDLKAAAGDVKSATSSVGDEARKQLSEVGQFAAAENKIWADEKEQIEKSTNAIKKQQDEILSLTKAHIVARAAEKPKEWTPEKVEAATLQAEMAHSRATGRGDLESLEKQRQSMADRLKSAQDLAETDAKILETRKQVLAKAVTELGELGKGNLTDINDVQRRLEQMKSHLESDANLLRQRTTPGIGGVTYEMPGDRDNLDKTEKTIASVDAKLKAITAYEEALGGDNPNAPGMRTAEERASKSAANLKRMQEAFGVRAADNQAATTAVSEKLRQEELENYKKEQDLADKYAEARAQERKENRKHQKEVLEGLAVQTLADEKRRQEELRKLELEEAQEEANLSKSKSGEKQKLAEANLEHLKQQSELKSQEELGKKYQEAADRATSARFAGKKFSDITDQNIRSQIMQDVIRSSPSSGSPVDWKEYEAKSLTTSPAAAAVRVPAPSSLGNPPMPTVPLADNRAYEAMISELKEVVKLQEQQAKLLSGDDRKAQDQKIAETNTKIAELVARQEENTRHLNEYLFGTPKPEKFNQTQRPGQNVPDDVLRKAYARDEIQSNPTRKAAYDKEFRIREESRKSEGSQASEANQKLADAVAKLDEMKKSGHSTAADMTTQTEIVKKDADEAKAAYAALKHIDESAHDGHSLDTDDHKTRQAIIEAIDKLKHAYVEGKDTTKAKADLEAAKVARERFASGEAVSGDPVPMVTLSHAIGSRTTRHAVDAAERRSRSDGGWVPVGGDEPAHDDGHTVAGDILAGAHPHVDAAGRPIPDRPRVDNRADHRGARSGHGSYGGGRPLPSGGNIRRIEIAKRGGRSVQQQMENEEAAQRAREEQEDSIWERRHDAYVTPDTGSGHAKDTSPPNYVKMTYPQPMGERKDVPPPPKFNHEPLDFSPVARAIEQSNKDHQNALKMFAREMEESKKRNAAELKALETRLQSVMAGR